MTTEYNASYGGYNQSGYIYNASVCVKVSGLNYFCNIDNQEFYAADSVYQNNWNYYSSGESGTFGMGRLSPIWDIIGSPRTKLFDVYMTNFNMWTWADKNYTTTTDRSVINFGNFSTDYNITTDIHTTIKPKTGGSYLLPLKSFGFGMTNLTAGTEYYEDLLNSDYDIYGDTWSNTTSLALNFRGLGLPKQQFNKFSNLLSVISNGEATCISQKSGYCLLTNPCASYPDLWEYDFRMQFDSDQDFNYIRVPLATFAANLDSQGGACVVFVEYLDSNNDDSKSIMLGGLFFQSVYV